MEIKLTVDNFQREVLEASGPVIVDFWASWCGPCRMLAPVIEEIAKERTDIKVGKVNVDEEGALADAFEITSIPAVLLFRDGQIAGKAVGFRPKDALLAALGL